MLISYEIYAYTVQHKSGRLKQQLALELGRGAGDPNIFGYTSPPTHYYTVPLLAHVPSVRPV